MKLIEKEIITKVGYDNRGLIVRVERTDEEIVRCKDCEHLSLRGFHDTENGRFSACLFMRVPVTENSFCSWGERREDD